MLLLMGLLSIPNQSIAGDGGWYLRTNRGDTVAIEDICGINWGEKYAYDSHTFSNMAKYVYTERECDSKVTIRCKFGDIKDVSSFTFFKKETTGIKEVSNSKSRLSLNITESSIVLMNTTAGKKIRIISISGVVMKDVISTDNETIIDMSNLTPSVYILSVDGNIIKFIKK